MGAFHVRRRSSIAGVFRLVRRPAPPSSLMTSVKMRAITATIPMSALVMVSVAVVTALMSPRSHDPFAPACIWVCLLDGR